MSAALRALLIADRALGLDFAVQPSGSMVSSNQVASAPAGTMPRAAGRPEAPAGASPVVAASSPTVRPVPAAVPPPMVASGSKAERLEALRLEHAANCPHCTRVTGHTHLVFGEGDPDARLVFVGEAPGEREDQLGRPFVGRAGQKLDEMIAAMGLRREEAYIANVLKARPPGNRTPLPDEVMRCGPTLLRQLAIIRPLVIVTLGAPATKFLLDSDAGISRLRGVWSRWTVPESLGGGEIDLMPTFHPAYLLRNYTPETRKAVWSDLRQVMERLGVGKSAGSA